ncbi:MAG: tandem-95 repeat protein, partial [Hyphomicrobium sp.]
MGSDLLTEADLSAHATALATIGGALSATGDILLYGCNITSGDEGSGFVETLAGLTGADIAASNDDTGASALGGDWVLEAHSGEIGASAISADDYQSLLAVTAVNDVALITATVPPAADATVSGNVLTNDSSTGTSKSVIQVHGFDNVVGQPLAASYGSITMNADGSYVYTVDGANPTVRGLDSTQTITDIIAYTVRDNLGGVDYAYLTVTIRGVSEAPVAYDNYNSVTPVSAPSASGNILTDDNGAGVDTVDRPLSRFIWETQYTNGTNPIGTARTIDGVNVAVGGTGVIAADGTTTRTVSTASQGGHAGYLNWALDPARMPYTAPTTTFAFSQQVINLEFSLNDLDISGAPNAAGTVSWQDKVVITGTRTVGGVTTEVSFSAQPTGRLTTVGTNGFEGLGETGFRNVAASDADGNVHIVFDGPVDNVVVTFTDGSLTSTAAGANPGNHVIGITDLSWQNPNAATVVSVEGTTLAATGTTTIAGTYGTLSIRADGTYTYAVDAANPAVIALPAGAALIDSFDYTLRDLLGQTTSAALVITVNGINEAPMAGDDTATASENTATTIPSSVLRANDSDVDTGTVLTIISVQDAVNGTVAMDGSGNPVFTPAANYSGPASFTYTLSDGQGGFATATVNLTVAPVN